MATSASEDKGRIDSMYVDDIQPELTKLTALGKLRTAALLDASYKMSILFLPDATLPRPVKIFRLVWYSLLILWRIPGALAELRGSRPSSDTPGKEEDFIYNDEMKQGNNGAPPSEPDNYQKGKENTPKLQPLLLNPHYEKNS